MSDRIYVVTSFETLRHPDFQALSDADFGRLMRYYFAYAELRIEPNDIPNALFRPFTRLQVDADRHEAKRAKKSEQARAAASSRWEHTSNTPVPEDADSACITGNANDANDADAFFASNYINIPISNNKLSNISRPTRAEARAVSDEFLDNFDGFWAIYPRRQAKKEAQKAWMKIKPDAALVQCIIESVERWKSSPEWQRDGGRFIPYPASFLNGQRWEDELPPTSPVSEARVPSDREWDLDRLYT